MKKVEKQLDTVDKLSAIVFAPQTNSADYYTRIFEIIEQLDTVDKLSAIVFAPQTNGADYYTRIVEIIDFLYSYFAMNICPQDAGEMTLNELKKILQPKIDFYSRFVATDEAGVFAVAETLK